MAQDESAYATPESTISEYLAGVASQDIERILSAAAIDETSEGFDFASTVDRMGAFIPFAMLAPSEFPFYVDINRVKQRDNILRQVQVLAYALLSGEEIDGRPIRPVDAFWVASFVLRVDPARLADIEVVDIQPSDPTFMADPRYLELTNENARQMGADEMTERVVLFSFDGELYDLGFTLLRYGDEWKISRQSSALSGIDPLGTARPTTLEEFELQTSGG